MTGFVASVGIPMSMSMAMSMAMVITVSTGSGAHGAEAADGVADDPAVVISAGGGTREPRSFAEAMPLVAGTDIQRRAEALSWIDDADIDIDQGLALVAAAGADYTADTGAESVAYELIHPLWRIPDERYIDPIVAGYDRLAGKRDACEAALRVLVEIHSERALHAFIDLLRRPTSRSLDLGWVFIPADTARDGALMPGLLDMVEVLEHPSPVYAVILAGVEKGAWSVAGNERFIATCRARTRSMMDAIAAFGVVRRQYPGSDVQAVAANVGQADDQSLNASKAEAEKRVEARADACAELEVLLDLLGHVQGSEPLLRDALATMPDSMKAWAAVALAHLGSPPEADVWERLAKQPSARATLYQALDRDHRLDLFPARWLTQDALAEAALASWLEFPTELGAAPFSMRLLAKHPLVADDHRQILYVFAFRETDAEAEMVGVSGPYDVDASPRLWGAATFSKFERLDAKPLAAHIADYTEDP